MKNEKRLNNIKSVSRFMQWILVLAIIGGVFSMCFVLTMKITGGIGSMPEITDNLWFVLVVGGIELAAMFFIYKILKNFRQGLLFLSDNVRWLKIAVYLKFADWVALFAQDAVSKAAGKASQHNNVDIVLLLMMMLFAYILEEAVELHEEGKLTI